MFLGITQECLAATYYVRIDGNNNCTGLNDQGGSSGDCAWRTLQHAADAVQAGDMVLVGNGTYQGFMIQAHGTVSAPIIFRAQSDEVNITTHNLTTNDGINIESWGDDPADYVTIDGFNVYNQPRMGVRAIGGTGITIQNCNVHNNVGQGIFSGDTPNIQVLNNISYANGSSAFEHNIYISNSLSDGAIIKGNSVYASGGGNGIQLNGDWQSGGDGFIDNAVVEDNIVYNNHFKGLSLISIRYGRIQNNIIYNNGISAGGIHLVQQPGGPYYSIDNTVVNNTIDEPNIACIRINADNTGNVVFNNILIGPQPIAFEGSSNYESNNYSAGSALGIFVDRSNRDYHLAEDSPAISYGIATYQSRLSPPLDLDGVIRPQGSGHDSGAYEFVEESVPDITAPEIPTELMVQ